MTSVHTHKCVRHGCKGISEFVHRNGCHGCGPILQERYKMEVKFAIPVSFHAAFLKDASPGAAESWDSIMTLDTKVLCVYYSPSHTQCAPGS